MMGSHCSTLPVMRKPFYPANPYVQLSTKDIASQLEVTFTQPAVDLYGFKTITNVDNHAPNQITDYIIEWSDSSKFDANVNSTTFKMLQGDNVTLDCADKCRVTIGAPILNLTVASGNDEPLTSGSFKLVYTGEQSPKVLVQTEISVACITCTTTFIGQYVLMFEASRQIPFAPPPFSLLPR